MFLREGALILGGVGAVPFFLYFSLDLEALSDCACGCEGVDGMEPTELALSAVKDKTKLMLPKIP